MRERDDYFDPICGVVDRVVLPDAQRFPACRDESNTGVTAPGEFAGAVDAVSHRRAAWPSPRWIDPVARCRDCCAGRTGKFIGATSAAGCMLASSADRADERSFAGEAPDEQDRGGEPPGGLAFDGVGCGGNRVSRDPRLHHGHQCERRRDRLVQGFDRGGGLSARRVPHGLLRRAGGAQVERLKPIVALPQIQPAAGRMRPPGSWTAERGMSPRNGRCRPTRRRASTSPSSCARTGSLAQSHIVFVVRDDDDPSDLLFQTSDTTWQAYNAYGDSCLYDHLPVTPRSPRR